MRIVTDLEEIRRLAEERDDENWDFRSYLKQYDGGEDEIDEHVHNILAEVGSQIDCTACGNCCTALRPELDDADVARLAEGLSMTPEAFREKYVETDEEGSVVLRGEPCPFLENKRCTVYAHRPEGCRSYPHLHKDGFVFRLTGVVNSYAVCPIVFNVYERLKDQLWPRRRRRETGEKK